MSAPIAAASRVPVGARNWQRVLTIIFLALGLLGLIGAMALPPLPLLFALSGPGAASQRFGVNPSAGGLLVFDAWAQVILFVVSAVLSIWLLSRRKIAFYVPLGAGIVAVILFWAIYLVALVLR